MTSRYNAKGPQQPPAAEAQQQVLAVHLLVGQAEVDKAERAIVAAHSDELGGIALCVRRGDAHARAG